MKWFKLPVVNIGISWKPGKARQYSDLDKLFLKHRKKFIKKNSAAFETAEFLPETTWHEHVGPEIFQDFLDFDQMWPQQKEFPVSKCEDYWNLRGLKFDSLICGVRFRKCDFTNASFRSVGDSLFYDCRFANNDFRDTYLQYYFENCEFDHVRFMHNPACFAFIIKDCTFKQCVFDTYGRGDRFLITNSRFDKCSFRRVVFDASQIVQSDFTDCDFWGADFATSPSHYVESSFNNCNFRNTVDGVIPDCVR
ncbi:pentapeptide repeat-containing protein [Candidatus Sumerlaeota bacterium]